MDDVLEAFERRAFSLGQADRALTFLFGFSRHRAAARAFSVVCHNLGQFC